MPRPWIVSRTPVMIEDVARWLVGSLMLAAFVVACGRAPSGTPAEIVELSTSVEALRRDFDAHAGEPRFVTMLAPT